MTRFSREFRFPRALPILRRRPRSKTPTSCFLRCLRKRIGTRRGCYRCRDAAPGRSSSPAPRAWSNRPADSSPTFSKRSCRAVASGCFPARALPPISLAACDPMVIAAPIPRSRRSLRRRFPGRTFRLYPSADRTGVQLGGALKNVLAIAAASSKARPRRLGPRCADLARLAEMSRFIVARGGEADTVRGLSGLGDLVLTADEPPVAQPALRIALGKDRPGCRRQRIGGGRFCRIRRRPAWRADSASRCRSRRPSQPSSTESWMSARLSNN